MWAHCLPSGLVRLTLTPHSFLSPPWQALCHRTGPAPLTWPRPGPGGLRLLAGPGWPCPVGLVTTLPLTPAHPTPLATPPAISGHIPIGSTSGWLTAGSSRLPGPRVACSWLSPSPPPPQSGGPPCCVRPSAQPRAALTSLLRPTSRAAAVEATAAATAAARPRPGSAGSCRKSGAAAGCTSSEGKRPTRPWMVPNRQPRGREGL